MALICHALATAGLMTSRTPVVITRSGEGAVERSVLSRSIRSCFWRIAVHRIDVSDDRRTAEDVLTIDADEISDVVVELAKSKRLSIVIANLNRLMQHATDRELARRALRHLGFPED
jgi:hypothetical protein